MIRERANAKINLGLNIRGTRADGYHELEMIELPLSLSDELTMFPSSSFTLITNYDLPEQNTINKAIEAARSVFGFKEQFTVVLDKQIPAEAGLGGGSADGATILRMLRKHFGWKVSDMELAKIGAGVGADVPFCVVNKPAVVRGIGEIVEPFELTKDYWALLVKPASGVSTPLAYRKYEETGGDHPDIARLKEALVLGNEKEIAEYMGNSLEKAAFTLNRSVEPIKMELRSLGIHCSMMTGSGATVFGMSSDHNRLKELKARFQTRYGYAAVVQVLK